MLLYGNFNYTPIYSTPQASSGGGGKGGLFGGGGGGGGQAAAPTVTGYNYYAAFAFALSEGPIIGIGKVWQDKNYTTLAALGFSLYLGTYPQTAWGTTVTWSYVNAAGTTVTGTSTPLGYNGISYVAAASYSLGGNTSMPNHTFEIEGIYSTSVSGQSDADPTLVLTDLLTNAAYGAGFPSASLGSMTNWQNYCLAAGLLISPAYTTQQIVANMVDEIAVATNSAPVWSSGVLTMVPFGDKALTGNSKTYTPPASANYDLTDNDFVANPQGGSGGGGGPVQLIRKRSADKINSVKVEYLDRANQYQPAVAYANDQALIQTYGLRTNGSKQMHLFCDATMANLSANLMLRREQVSNTYKFDLDQRFVLLDPMDIVSLTDSALGLSAQWVRITEIMENDDGTFSMTAEEYLAGTGAAPAYTFGQGSGTQVNVNGAPGALNNPIFFEPSYSLAGNLEVWCALSGPAATWGGADVYISTDGVNYALAGRITGAARMGVTTATLATYTETVTGNTVDQTNTLSVNLTESGGVLTSASQQQAADLSSLCYVGGELVSYATATLTATDKYDLTYLIRGAYGTTISAHASGSDFARLDNGIFKLPFTQDRIGSIIAIKFLSFNQYGGGQITLAQAVPYSYTIQGTALASDLANVTNLAPAFIGNISSIDWTEISDFRPILYEVRVGSSWDSAQFLARQAHPPFRTRGDGTYWVSAYSQPVANLVVYSTTAQSVVISGSNITDNIIATRTENPAWTGTLSGAVSLVGADIESTTTGGGYYTIPTGDRITTTYPFACAVIIKWTSTGSPLNDSVFAYSGTAVLTNASATVSGLRIFSGTGRLYGNATIDNLNTTAHMGAGQPIDGTGIASGAVVLAVLSTTSISMTLNATTGSTITSSTQTVNVYPYLVVGQIIESTVGHIPAGASITALSSTSKSVITMSTTASASSTDAVTISIDWLNTPDFLGAAAAANVDVHPEIRMSTDAGATWGSWQRFVSGYYLGSGFDARMSVVTNDINSVAILSAMSFSVDVPDRWDHYNSLAVSSTGLSVTFKPDGGTTAAFNGGPQGSTDSKPAIVSNIMSGSANDSIVVSAITLSGCVVNCYTSTGGAAARTVNLIAKGY